MSGDPAEAPSPENGGQSEPEAAKETATAAPPESASPSKPEPRDEVTAQMSDRLNRAAAELAEMGGVKGDAIATKRKRVLDLPLSVQVMIGTTQMSVSRLLEMQPKDLLTLDKDIHQPLDVLVNGQVFARGELSVMEDQPDRFGVRIIEIIGEET